MKSFLIFRLGCSVALPALFIPAVAFAQSSVTIDVSAGILRNSSGATLSPNGLVLLIADTGNNGFGSLQAGSSLSLGSLVDADDQIIGIGSTMGGPFAGQVDLSANPNLESAPYTNLNTGESVALVWFSDLTSSSPTITAGENYGLFMGTVADSTDGLYTWTVPEAGDSIDLNFKTTSDGGTHLDSEGDANLTAVPEPATYSLIAGAVALVGAVTRRRYGRKSLA